MLNLDGVRLPPARCGNDKEPSEECRKVPIRREAGGCGEITVT